MWNLNVNPWKEVLCHLVLSLINAEISPKFTLEFELWPDFALWHLLAPVIGSGSSFWAAGRNVDGDGVPWNSLWISWSVERPWHPKQLWIPGPAWTGLGASLDSGRWNGMSFIIPPNPNCSVIPWFELKWDFCLFSYLEFFAHRQCYYPLKTKLLQWNRNWPTNEYMGLEKASSSDFSSQFHGFNLHSSGRKRPDTKLIVFFCGTLPLQTFFLLASS